MLTKALKIDKEENLFNYLPDEVINFIIGMLDIKDINQFAKTNTMLHDLMNKMIILSRTITLNDTDQFNKPIETPIKIDRDTYGNICAYLNQIKNQKKEAVDIHPSIMHSEYYASNYKSAIHNRPTHHTFHTWPIVLLAFLGAFIYLMIYFVDKLNESTHTIYDKQRCKQLDSHFNATAQNSCQDFSQGYLWGVIATVILGVFATIGCTTLAACFVKPKCHQVSIPKSQWLPSLHAVKASLLLLQAMEKDADVSVSDILKQLDKMIEKYRTTSDTSLNLHFDSIKNFLQNRKDTGKKGDLPISTHLRMLEEAVAKLKGKGRLSLETLIKEFANLSEIMAKIRQDLGQLAFQPLSSFSMSMFKASSSNHTVINMLPQCEITSKNPVSNVQQNNETNNSDSWDEQEGIPLQTITTTQLR